METRAESFDFMVIGTGSGLDVANVAADRGQSVAVVEKGPLGGTCLNRGCIPSKHLLYHAEIRETVERASEFGIEAEVTDVDFAGIVRKVNEDVAESSESIHRGITGSERHTLLEGTGEFVDHRTVEIVAGPDEGRRAAADTVLIAAGTRPAIPPIAGIDDVRYLTSTEALQLQERPDHLVIVGGGYIAAELAHFFGTFGSDVTIIGRRPHLLPQGDEDVQEALTERYRERFDILTGYEATAVEETVDGVTVDAQQFPEAMDESEEDEPLSVTGDHLLVAAGRRPNTDLLGLEHTAVEVDEDGFVETDEYLRTAAEHVWALGDIVGEYLLKHNANHEARAVARNIFGDELEPVDYTAMPFGVFSAPEVAGVGQVEQELTAEETPYATRVHGYEETARGDAMGAEGFVKVIIDLEGTILGCHIIGPEATNLIQEVVVAMQAGSGTVEDIGGSVHIHPALSEVVDRAFAGQFVRGDAHDHGHNHDH